MFILLFWFLCLFVSLGHFVLFPFASLFRQLTSVPISVSILVPILNRSVASPSDNLISLSYSMPASVRIYSDFFLLDICGGP